MPHFQTPDGLNLYYTDEGTGVPILCLSGLTRDSQDFNFVTPHLTGVSLIKMDYRGRGQSDWADDYSTYSVPQEAQDAIALLDHLGIEKAAILGTSRGGLIAMFLAATAKDRLIGVALNDIGPVIDQGGLDGIMDYIGRNPAAKTIDDAVEQRAKIMVGFNNVPDSRWREELSILYHETENGLQITYDPKLRDAVALTFGQPQPDLWPLFEALNGLPLALIHGENSDLLSDATVTEMRNRQPDMIYGRVPDRGHIPFLDEPQSLEALHKWIGKLSQ